jgi:hypothetical protein
MAVSKALLNSSHKYYEASKHFKGMGIMIEGLKMDISGMQKQKDEAVTGMFSACCVTGIQASCPHMKFTHPDYCCAILFTCLYLCILLFLGKVFSDK